MTKKLSITQKIGLSLVIGLFSLIIDYIFHVVATSPMETYYYFLIKFLLASTAVFIVLSFKKITIVKSLVASFIFMLIFSSYYRVYEIFSFLPFGYRVPITFGSDSLIIAGISFSIVHTLTLFIPLIIALKLSKRLN